MCRGSQSQCTRVYMAQEQSVLVDKTCVVAERYLASAYQPFSQSHCAHSSKMANTMLRGAQAIGAGDAVLRSARAGLIGVSMAGGLAIDRARNWCQQRRGRQQIRQCKPSKGLELFVVRTM